MKRKIYDKLVEWKKQNGKTALLVEGARRVGKSYIVEEFAKKNYKSYILIDFAFTPDEIKNLFYEYGNNLDMLFMYLQEFYQVYHLNHVIQYYHSFFTFLKFIIAFLTCLYSSYRNLKISLLIFLSSIKKCRYCNLISSNVPKLTQQQYEGKQ